jgi:hypothetical protein
MNLYKSILTGDMKEILKGVNNDTLAILGSGSKEEEYVPISEELKESLVNNLSTIMQNKVDAGLVSKDVQENFGMYKDMVLLKEAKHYKTV